MNEAHVTEAKAALAARMPIGSTVRLLHFAAPETHLGTVREHHYSAYVRRFLVRVDFGPGRTCTPCFPEELVVLDDNDNMPEVP